MNLRVFSFLVLAALGTPAIADSPNYNFVQGTYQRADLDEQFGIDIDGDGFGLSGSFDVGQDIHVFGGYQQFDFDFGIDLDELALGIGWHPAISQNTDLVATLAYINAEAEGFGVSADEDGYSASVGLRSMLTDNFELAGSLVYTDIGSGDGDVSVAGQTWYNLTESFAIGAGVEADDDVVIYGIGIRVYFDN